MAISDEFLNEPISKALYLNMSTSQNEAETQRDCARFIMKKHRPLPFIPRVSRSIASVAAQAATQ